MEVAETELLQRALSLLENNLPGGNMDWMKLLELILPLLKSLLVKDIDAAKAGHDGPLTAYFKAQDAGKDNQGCMKAAAEAYVRCCP